MGLTLSQVEYCSCRGMRLVEFARLEKHHPVQGLAAFPGLFRPMQREARMIPKTTMQQGCMALSLATRCIALLKLLRHGQRVVSSRVDQRKLGGAPIASMALLRW